MLLIPAIDLKDGRCVRLRQGDMKSETVFSEDPVGVARHWVAQGARRLQRRLPLVRLDDPLFGRFLLAVAGCDLDEPTHFLLKFSAQPSSD